MTTQRLFLAFSLCALISSAVAAEGEARACVACIGDSITFGYGDENGKGYPVRLQAALGASWEVKNFGIPGTTLSPRGDKPYVDQVAWQEAREYKPQFVVIMLGTNDSKNANVGNADGLKDDLVTMVKELQALDSQPKVVICQPCFVADPGAYEINEAHLASDILPAVEAAAKELNLPLLDLHAMTRDVAAKDAGFFVDKVHPNPDGHTLIAAAVQQALQKASAPEK